MSTRVCENRLRANGPRRSGKALEVVIETRRDVASCRSKDRTLYVVLWTVP